MVTKLDGTSFDEFIKSNDVVVVDFYADWCGPCKMMGPIINAYAEAHPEVKVAKVNIDDDMELAIGNKVSSVPTLMLYKGGEFVSRSIGALSKAELETFVAGE